jgi:hypothetical protein
MRYKESQWQGNITILNPYKNSRKIFQKSLDIYLYRVYYNDRKAKTHKTRLKYL